MGLSTVIRWLIAWVLLVCGVGCLTQADAFFQSRDSNYNVAISGGGGSTTTFDPANHSAGVTLSGGNLVATANTTNTNGQIARAIASHSTGKYYNEFVVTTAPGGNLAPGIINGSQSVTNTFLGGTGNNSIGWYKNGQVFLNNSAVTTISAFVQGNTIEMAVDLGNTNIWFRVLGGNWNNNGTANPATNTGGISISVITTPVFPAVDVEDNNDAFTANFGGSAYADTPPSGFGNW